MASYSGTFGGTGGTPRFRLEGFPEEEEEGIPIARSFDQLLLTQTEDRPRITIRREPEYGVAAGDSSSVMQRRPYLFSPPRNTSQSSIFSNPSAVGGNDQQNNQANAAAMVGQLQQEENMAIRYRLFNRLDPGGANLLMPTHDDDGKQSSLVTVFSIWNTMVGTSLLAVPWALQQAGLIFGIILMLVMAAIAFYTAYRIVESPNSLALETTTPDFSDVCRFFWGKYGEYFSVFFSVMVLIGGVVLYFVLMSNFLYFTGNVIYESLQPNSTILPIMVNNSLICDVYCPEPFKSAYPDDLLSLVNPWFSSASDLLYAEKGSYFRDIWKLQGGVPLILALCLFPLLNFKSPGFFMRFNVLGTVSVVYLLCFTLTKSFECGLNIDFLHPNSEHFVHLFNWKFPALTGTLALSYFIHNAILTILRNQKHPENNARDLLIGYILSAGCYIVISVVFFLAFPTFRNCISDNFLNNFGGGDVLSAIARIFLLFQMLTVLPLLMYLIRVQFSYVFAGTVYPGLFYVLLINIGILTIALFFGVVYPHVGPIIRYVGSICGLVYMFLLPCGVHLKRLQMQGRLTPFQIGIHAFIMFCGVINLFAQFLV